MKLSRANLLSAPLALALLAAPCASASPQEKEYDDAVLALVDAKEGWLGFTVTDDSGENERRLTLKTDPQKVDVTNRLNQVLEFSQLQPGDRVDFYTEPGPGGQETVTEIIAYDRYEE